MRVRGLHLVFLSDLEWPWSKRPCRGFSIISQRKVGHPWEAGFVSEFKAYFLQSSACPFFWIESSCTSLWVFNRFIQGELNSLHGEHGQSSLSLEGEHFHPGGQTPGAKSLGSNWLVRSHWPAGWIKLVVIYMMHAWVDRWCMFAKSHWVFGQVIRCSSIQHDSPGM